MDSNRTPQALVTGASRGIGKAIAISLAEAGYDVAISARTLRRGEPTREHSMSIRKTNDTPLPGSLEETAEAIETTGRKALSLAFDLTDQASVEKAMADLLDQWGGVDVVVNDGRHIGPGLMDTILDTPLEQYRLFMEAHAVAPIRMAQLLLPTMLERGGGTFVTISSGAGTDFYPPNYPGRGGVGLGYRIGKASGHTLVGSLLSEHSADGIRAFNVDPGMVATERNSPELIEHGQDPTRFAPPAAIGAVIAWMVSNPAADHLQRRDNEAQELALEYDLYPDWRH
ncbi:MAG: family NAD(P)-dependent oxidoreductase [Pseudonocardiales bacterium]|nr:family NAD(P)-dependent oxidoreductase [Pseudonocardiales bacterium]